MIKRIILQTLFFISMIIHLKAQRVNIDSLLGNWTIKSFSLDSTIIFDTENPQSIIDANFIKLKSSNPKYTIKDSLSIVKKAQTLIDDSKNIFIKFNSDGTYTNAKISGNGRITGDVESGQYVFNELNQQIIQTDQSGRKIIFDVSLDHGLLRLKIENGRKFVMIYKKS